MKYNVVSEIPKINTTAEIERNTETNDIQEKYKYLK